MLKRIKSLYARLHHYFHPKIRLITHRWKNFIDRNRQTPILYCIGDSHNELFEYIQKENLIPTTIRCVTVQGATIFGLANPNSKTNALPIFKKELLNAPPHSNLTIILGEIDCGFLIWLRSQKNGTRLEDEMNESIRRYKDFLLWIKSLNLNKIIVVSVPPQTITDNDNAGAVANARKSARTTLAERKNLTSKYNNNLKLLSDEIGIYFLNMDDNLINASGNVHKHLLNKDPADHHLYSVTTSPLYAKKLRELIGFGLTE